MPKLSVEGVGEFEVPQGKRLVNALTDEAKIDQLHSCVAFSRPHDISQETGGYTLRQATERVSE